MNGWHQDRVVVVPPRPSPQDDRIGPPQMNGVWIMNAKPTLAMCGLCCLSIFFFASTASAQQKPSTDTSVDAEKATGDNPKRAAREGQNDDTVKKSESKTGSFWMEQKLRFSKEILTGLANADFDQLARNAELMRGLNRVEAFMRGRKEGYRDQLKQFDMANKAIIRAAQNGNLEGATLAFNQLTISCVTCHQHLRETTLTPNRVQNQKQQQRRDKRLAPN